jgi:hypothetical protein
MLLQQQGHHDAALSSLEAAISNRTWVSQERLLLLLAHLAIVAARAGRPQRAAAALTDLEALPGRTPAVEAVMSQTRAEIDHAAGCQDAATGHLRRALSTWAQVGCPLAAAETRLRLAQFLLAAGERRMAALELSLAEQTFETHQAPVLARRCRALREAEAY